MRFKRLHCYALVLAATVCMAQTAFARQKYALVIGNAEYQRIDKLKNTVNDAQDIGAALQGLGFQVELKLNASHLQMI